MEKKTLNIFNVAVIIVILVVALFSWFYMRDQFVWGILLIILLLLITILVNAAGRGMSSSGVGMVLVAFLILGFAWFYMRDQFMWAIIDVLLLFILYELLKLIKWIKNAVSIQVIIHKYEKNEDGKADDKKSK
jgi:predicted membrane protein